MKRTKFLLGKSLIFLVVFLTFSWFQIFLPVGAIEKKPSFSSPAPTVEESLREWFFIRDHFREAGYTRILNFLASHPGWPAREAFLKRVEMLLFESKSPDIFFLLSHYFSHYKPTSPYGEIIKARLYRLSGEDQKAFAVIKVLWKHVELPQAIEKEIFKEWGAALGIKEHQARFDRLLFSQKVKAAETLAAFLTKDDRRVLHVAKAFIAQTKIARTLYQGLSASLRRRPVLLYLKTRFLRQSGDLFGARDTLLQAPHKGEDIWNTERKILARLLLGRGPFYDPQGAYTLSLQKTHSTSVYDAELSFLEGFVALQFLKKPNAASEAFRKMAQHAGSRTQKSRAFFWLGQAEEALKHSQKAQEAYRAASFTKTVFYGMLAQQRLKKRAAAVLDVTLKDVSAPVLHNPKFSEQDSKIVRKNPLFQVVLFLHRQGKSVERDHFLKALVFSLKKSALLAAAAHLLEPLKAPEVGVRFAKMALEVGVDLDFSAYPKTALPLWRSVSLAVDRAFFVGLIAQESEFSQEARSPAGAIGLSQMLSSTAQQVARKYAIAYSFDQLQKDPRYNLTLGEAYVSDLLKLYNGSYLLAAAAYNAGPSSVNQWIIRYQNPRDPGVSTLQWMESIPFSETRLYVQKILKNRVIYRIKQ